MLKISERNIFLLTCLAYIMIQLHDTHGQDQHLSKSITINTDKVTNDVVHSSASSPFESRRTSIPSNNEFAPDISERRNQQLNFYDKERKNIFNNNNNSAENNSWISTQTFCCRTRKSRIKRVKNQKRLKILQKRY
ncbi:hypothetical protein CEXT_113201 [Caerostris extrusa]|uniref:Uncharacterized protein n=1 Tax=Caerostris extrusa TaxID=172846 RepID=A0AAV4XSK7_CAEEX|nr:hypothetical protein CEXT_113201 [Caerostris extrusa]